MGQFSAQLIFFFFFFFLEIHLCFYCVGLLPLIVHLQLTQTLVGNIATRWEYFIKFLSLGAKFC